MSKTTAASALVAVTVGAPTALLAYASAEEWVSGTWTEALLVLGVVVVVVAVGWVVMSAVMDGVLWLLAYFVAPVQPVGLDRVLRIMDLHAAELETATRENEVVGELEGAAQHAGELGRAAVRGFHPASERDPTSG